MAKHIFLGGIGVLLGAVLTGMLGTKVDPKNEIDASAWLIVMAVVCVILASGLIWLGDA